MEWFKHKTASHDDPDISDAWDKFGDAGYTVFFVMLEIYGQEFGHLKDGWLSISETFLRRKLRKSSTKARQILNFYSERHRIEVDTDATTIRIRIPTFMDLASNWTRRPSRGTSDAPTAIEVEVEVEKKEEKKGFGTLPRRIVEYLNNALSSSFKYQSKTTQAHIKARIREGFTEHDFYKVIDFKASQWGSDPKMQEYLRPNTLFGPKMEGYLQSAGSYRPDADSFDDRKRIEERDAKIQAECDEIKREVGLL